MANKNRNINNRLFNSRGRLFAGRWQQNKVVSDEHIEYLCDLNNRDTSVPQDVDTKVALRDIEERGVSAIGDVLDRAMPDIPDEDYSNSKGGRNSANYGEIKWESKETKERIKGWKYCPVCGDRLKKPRLNKDLKTCSKACTDELNNSSE